MQTLALPLWYFGARTLPKPWTPTPSAPISSPSPTSPKPCRWGANLVFWVGDKSIGGKMFCVIDLDDPTPSKQRTAVDMRPVLSYAAGPTRYPELLETEGLVPAPYLARAHWIAAQHWDVFTPTEWHRELHAAHALTLAKLPPRTRKILNLPAAEQRGLITARRKLLATPKKESS